MQTEADFDVVLVGAGIMSATLATMIRALEPEWKIAILERQSGPALESSNAWNNAGTGHAALCELNYTAENADGSISIQKAIDVNEQFQVSRQFWSWLVNEGIIADPASFISATPHMSFVWGEKNVDFLRRRFEALKNQPLFKGMKFTDDFQEIADWAPLLVEDRLLDQPVAATYSSQGSDVDFGSLTRQLMAAAESMGVHVVYEQEVRSIKKKKGQWLLKSKTLGAELSNLSAKFVFVGAGGGALRLLHSSGIKEAKGYAGFPVSGQFFKTNNPELIAKHDAKVYGKAAVGAPPMSVPHLDIRNVDGEKSLLFGPYAGFSLKFLIGGSFLDLLKSVRLHNILPLTSVGFQTFGDGLLKYLVSQVLSSKKKKFKALQEFMPEANYADWELIVAGQRVQVIKPAPKKFGVLQFGTEVISSADGSIAGLLGASPGASTAAPIMLQILERCFPEKQEAWRSKLKEMVPSISTVLSDDPVKAKESIEVTAKTLKLKV